MGKLVHFLRLPHPLESESHGAVGTCVGRMQTRRGSCALPGIARSLDHCGARFREAMRWSCDRVTLTSTPLQTHSIIITSIVHRIYCISHNHSIMLPIIDAMYIGLRYEYNYTCNYGTGRDQLCTVYSVVRGIDFLDACMRPAN